MASISVDISNSSELPTETFQDLCNAAFDDIVSATPVATGACAAAWEIDFPDYDSCTMNNDTEYVSFLEEGWSDQAPNGMVAITLDKFSLDYSLS